MSKSNINSNNLMITNSFKAIGQSDELNKSLKDVIKNMLNKANSEKTSQKTKTQWTKKEPIQKRQADIPNPKLKYSMVRVFELAQLYNEIYLLKRKVNSLMDEQNKLLDIISEQNRTIVNERILRKQIIEEEKKKILNDFLNEQKKILYKLNKI